MLTVRLSFVITGCGGNERTCSRRSIRARILSMNGTRNTSPGSSTALNRPSRSTTAACGLRDDLHRPHDRRDDQHDQQQRRDQNSMFRSSNEPTPLPSLSATTSAVAPVICMTVTGVPSSITS